MKRLAVFLACCLLLAGTTALRAITVVPRDLDQLVQRADTVFKGEVIAKQARWAGDTPETRHIATRVTFRVRETYKGNAVPVATLEFAGGTVDGKTLAVPGVPQFSVGQVAVLFVVGQGRQFCPLVGIAQGRFHVVKDAATGTERILTDDGGPLVSTAEIGQVDETGAPRVKHYPGTSVQAMAADTFKAEILGKVAALGR